MLQTIEPFFIRSSWSLVTTFLFPKERHNHEPLINLHLLTHRDLNLVSVPTQTNCKSISNKS